MHLAVFTGYQVLVTRFLGKILVLKSVPISSKLNATSINATSSTNAESLSKFLVSYDKLNDETFSSKA